MDTERVIAEMVRDANALSPEAQPDLDPSQADTVKFEDQLINEFTADLEHHTDLALKANADADAQNVRAQEESNFSTADMISDLMQENPVDESGGMAFGVDGGFHHDQMGRSTRSTLYYRMGEFGTDALMEESAADHVDDVESPDDGGDEVELTGLDGDAASMDIEPEQMVDLVNDPAELDHHGRLDGLYRDESEEATDGDREYEDESEVEFELESEPEVEVDVEPEREVVAGEEVFGYVPRDYSGSGDRGDSQRESAEDDDEDDEDQIKVAELGGEPLVDSLGVGFGGAPDIFGVEPLDPEVFKDILMRLEGESKQLSGMTLAEAIYEVGGSLSHTEVALDPGASVETATVTEWTPTADGDMTSLQEKLVALADTYGDNSTVGEMFDQGLLNNQDMITLHSELRTRRFDT